MELHLAKIRNDLKMYSDMDDTHIDLSEISQTSKRTNIVMLFIKDF